MKTLHKWRHPHTLLYYPAYHTPKASQLHRQHHADRQILQACSKQERSGPWLNQQFRTLANSAHILLTLFAMLYGMNTPHRNQLRMPHAQQKLSPSPHFINSSGIHSLALKLNAGRETQQEIVPNSRYHTSARQQETWHTSIRQLGCCTGKPSTRPHS